MTDHLATSRRDIRLGFSCTSVPEADTLRVRRWSADPDQWEVAHGSAVGAVCLAKDIQNAHGEGYPKVPAAACLPS
jgi:hypothetical protein